jgi:hypothetical protein
LKHIIVLVLVAAGILYLATRKSSLEILMTPEQQYTAQQTGNRFVNVDPALLPVSPAHFAVPGVITVVYFHDDNCPGCHRLDQELDDFLRVRPDVAVRKIAMALNGDAYYDAIKNYRWRIYTAPCILIFGKDGKLIAADERTDSTGQDLLEEWISKELEKAANRKT